MDFSNEEVSRYFGTAYKTFDALGCFTTRAPQRYRCLDCDDWHAPLDRQGQLYRYCPHPDAPGFLKPFKEHIVSFSVAHLFPTVLEPDSKPLCIQYSATHWSGICFVETQKELAEQLARLRRDFPAQTLRVLPSQVIYLKEPENVQLFRPDDFAANPNILASALDEFSLDGITLHCPKGKRIQVQHRHCTILQALLANPKQRIAALAEQQAVALDTVKRYIRELKRLEVPVYHDKTHGYFHPEAFHTS